MTSCSRSTFRSPYIQAATKRSITATTRTVHPQPPDDQIDVLGKIEVQGWHLEHVSLTFASTGDIDDGNLQRGHHGTLVALYVFRRISPGSSDGGLDPATRSAVSESRSNQSPSRGRFATRSKSTSSLSLELRGVQMSNGRIVARDALFVPPRFVPNNHLLVGLGCELDGDAG